MLHRGTFAAEYREGKGAACHGNGTQKGGNRQFFHLILFHVANSFEVVQRIRQPWQRRFPVRVWQTPGPPGRSVETYWSPLTPEHGFPRCKDTAQGAPPPPDIWPLHLSPFKQVPIKIGGIFPKCPRKNQVMTPYGGIIRIR